MFGSVGYRMKIKAREVEQRYHVSAKQLTSDGLLMKIISSSHPDIECWPCEASLEDAYIYLSNIKLDVMPDDGKEKAVVQQPF